MMRLNRYLPVFIIVLCVLSGCNDSHLDMIKTEKQHASQKMTVLDGSSARDTVPLSYNQARLHYKRAQSFLSNEHYDEAKEELRLFHQLADQAIVQSTTIKAQQESDEMENIDALDTVYHVQKGDWLYKISRDQYGDQSTWKDIYELNKDIISHPNMIYPGQAFSLPKR